MSLRNESKSFALDLILGVRDAIGQARTQEHREYVTNLVEAKNAELDVNAIKLPMLTDRATVEIEATLIKKSALDVEGGVVWTIASAAAKYGMDKSESARALIRLETYSADVPDTAAMKEWSVDELNRFLTNVEN